MTDEIAEGLLRTVIKNGRIVMKKKDDYAMLPLQEPKTNCSLHVILDIVMSYLLNRLDHASLMKLA